MAGHDSFVLMFRLYALCVDMIVVVYHCGLVGGVRGKPTTAPTFMLFPRAPCELFSRALRVDLIYHHPRCAWFISRQ